ncbi:MAG: anaerobic sulfite reductase subunit AsrB [Bacilli bacterium]
MENIYMPTGYEIINIDTESEIEWLFEVKFDKKCRPGQFVEVSLPKVGEAPISITKIGEGFIELLIRKVGKVTDSIFNLKVGDKLFLRGPYGNSFDFDKLDKKDLVVISGGSGLAPVRPIINRFKDKSNFSLLAGFKNEEGILFKEEISQWKNVNDNINITLDCDNDICLIGFVTDHIDLIINNIDKNNCNIVVVGPPMMMKYTTLGLIERGISPQDIIVSFERNMSCAVGKCGHCKIDETYVCLEGPVFSYEKAVTLLD